MASKKGYLGLGRLASIILAIIPITNIILGIITRIQRNNLVGTVLNCIPIFWPFFWIIDMVCMIVNEKITVLA